MLQTASTQAATTTATTTATARAAARPHGHANGSCAARKPKGPYEIVRRDAHDEFRGNERVREVVVRHVRFGGPRPVVIAGPCAVESREQTLAIARACRDAGADCLRGGAFKPRTSPYDFQGLGEQGLEILAEARAETGLPIVTEALDPRHVDVVARYADVIQIGARNMQNVPLLVEAARTGKPLLLKRHWAATMTEWLASAEYAAVEGNLDVILCERGIRTFSQGSYNRSTLDLNVVQALRRETFLPVVVDPSHGTGVASLVAPASLAAIAAGAHGLIIEVIAEATDPDDCLCDGFQSIPPSVLRRIVLHARDWQSPEIRS
jgi:3-deoxy-7-phosphoheptulonate synthase